jgi:hypothetical protein
MLRDSNAFIMFVFVAMIRPTSSSWHSLSVRTVELEVNHLGDAGVKNYDQFHSSRHQYRTQ